MAHSEASEDLTASILAGSEELFDFSCQPCATKRHVEAVSYCQECSEYLCIACTEYHGNLSATKHHNVLDKSTMPKTKTPAKIQPADVLTEKCRKHPDKVLEYYCKSHSQVCCSVCLTLNHISCSKKGYIPDMSGGIDKSLEYLKLTADLDRLIRELTKRQKNISDCSKDNEKFHSKALVDIKDCRKEINELLDRMEEETKSKIEKFQRDNANAIRSTTAKCQSLLSDVKTMAVDLEKMGKTGKNNQLFVKVKRSCHRVAELERQIKDSSEYKITRYAFHQYEKIQQLKSTLFAIQSLSVGQDATPTYKARYVREVMVKAGCDKEKCLIEGVAVLTNARLIVVDTKNKNVKLINMKENTVVARLSLSSIPFDVTEINPNQVAVALGQQKKIGIITVSGGLSMSQSITTPGASIAGLCYNGSHFITACQQPGSVKIIDMSGKTLSTFSTDSKGEPLFTMPAHIALNRDKDVIYITDPDANTLTSMTLSGQVISVYRHEELMCPVGVVVGGYGAVFMCSEDNNTVHQLTATGKHINILLGPGQGVNYFPKAIAYNEDQQMLYISSSSSVPEYKNYIRLYQLE